MARAAGDHDRSRPMGAIRARNLRPEERSWRGRARGAVRLVLAAGRKTAIGAPGICRSRSARSTINAEGSELLLEKVVDWLRAAADATLEPIREPVCAADPLATVGDNRRGRLHLPVVEIGADRGAVTTIRYRYAAGTRGEARAGTLAGRAGVLG